MNNREKNVMAILSSLTVIIGTFLPFSKITGNHSLFGGSDGLSAMDQKCGWMFLLMAAIGLLSGIRDNGKLETFSGITVIALALFRRWETSHHSAEILGIFPGILEDGFGYYVLLGAGFGLFISALFSSTGEYCGEYTENRAGIIAAADREGLRV
ncbi:MAG: hypothetical protein IKP86_03865 [Anaerolineaceae bacterium]|nr:hypothetical protein [Anaerolineaceae bacterium]